MPGVENSAFQDYGEFQPGSAGGLKIFKRIVLLFLPEGADKRPEQPWYMGLKG
jgi:hypothetical protein